MKIKKIATLSMLLVSPLIVNACGSKSKPKNSESKTIKKTPPKNKKFFSR